MSIFDAIKKLFSSTPSPQTDPAAQPVCNNANTIQKKLTYAEKELLAVQRTTLQDVQQLTNFPYVWNGQLWKDIRPNSHPFAYMDLFGTNISIAKAELNRMNSYIAKSKSLCSKIPKSLLIPVDDVVFTKSQLKGYSRLICSPVTHLGEPADIPITLSFMTDMDRSNTTHGDLYYGRDGQIQKATIYFWRRESGYFLYYETVDNEFVLSRVEAPRFGGPNTVLYKGAHILAAESERAQEEKDFEWIQENIPDKCPKSISGYRRMKTQNTKNFQILKQLAAEKGRNI